ncbi:MAG: ABC transporter ATP-binding protein [Candidatus Methanofastidiosia archaeon]|jgi:ABC-2 type transport system ATP-binding protein
MTDPVIKVQNLGKTYYSRSTSVIALTDVNLEVNKGEVFGFLGPNGAGKTTLVKILVTLLKKSAGKAFVFQYDVDKDEEEIRKIVGYQGQDTERSGYLRFTARENLELFGRLRGIPKREVREAIEELQKIGNFDFLDKYFVALSIGQRQTTIVMRAFLDKKSKILFLDEPTSGLDPITALKVRNFIRDYAKEEKGTIILVSHDMYEVEYLCNQIALFNKGRIIGQGSPREIKEVIPTFYKVIITLPSSNMQFVKEVESLKYPQKLKNKRYLEIIIKSIYDIPDLLPILKKYDIEENFEIKKPSLEDAFFHLVGEDNDV